MSNEIKPYESSKIELFDPDKIDPYKSDGIDQYSGLDDWLYPDNDNRRNRANQLMGQCADMINNIADLKIETEKKLEDVSQSIRDAYKVIGKVPDMEKISLSNSLWVVVVPKVGVTSIFIAVTGAVYKIFERMAVSHLLRAGRIGEAALTKLVGLPKWLKFGTGVAAGAAGAVIALGIEVAIDAIIGSDTRSKLRTAIKDLAAPRIEFKYVELLSEYISKGLESTMMEVEKVKIRAEDESFSAEQLEKEIKAAIAMSMRLYKRVKPVPTVQDAVDYLNKKDNLLNAWKDEDQKDPAVLANIIKTIEGKYK
ncbi:hypothetical protein [Bacillus anthracis]|uniref:hypothetical protein n=1 Tax=Bacillus anthracis TaxID=1392 RepID=UPI000BF50969|nr:hypothetical protein [Bacillus anthracis]PGB45757.1 hypothetical protein COL95_29640 [Bacillus anthracis]